MFGEDLNMNIYKLQQLHGEDNYKQYNSEVTFTNQELIEKIKQYHNNIEINFEDEKWFEILEYTEGGRVKKIRIGNIEIPGTEVRTMLGLKSANFKISIENDTIKFSVIGYGHGVGMSQTGADSMAKAGKNFEEIIKHYYSGVEIIDV